MLRVHDDQRFEFSDLAALIRDRHTRVVRLINSELIDLYWELGKRISVRI